MNDYMERYLSATCSYFFGKKRDYVYQDLKAVILNTIDDYEDLESMLVSFGHPRSMAFNYGYKPLITHIFNPGIVHIFEKVFFSLSFLYLLLSTLYSLQQLNYPLLFKGTFMIPGFITWILTHPISVLSIGTIITFTLFVIIDYKNKVSQEYDLTWNKEELHKLPHPSHYPNHSNEVNVIILLVTYFIFYTLVFSSDIILHAQHTTYKMIHEMATFFQPFIMLTILVYVLDMTKKKYTKKYLKYSMFMSIFTLISFSIFVLNKHFLQNYLLPFYGNTIYYLINFSIIGAIVVLYIVILYKLIKNMKSYRFLYKK